MELKHLKYIKDENEKIRIEQDALWEALEDLVPINSFNDSYSLTEEMENLEMSAINDALSNSNQNRTKAAKLLGIGRTNLIAKMKKYRIS